MSSAYNVLRVHRTCRVPSKRFSSRITRKQHTTTNRSPDPIETLKAQIPGTEASSPRPTSRPRRVLRTIFYVGLFGVSGFSVAWGWKTWDYLHVGKILGKSTTRMSNKAYFEDKIKKSSLVKSLEASNWVEDDSKVQILPLDMGKTKKSNGNQGRHMVNEHLMENGYLVTRHFRHPTDKMTVLVFMADFACESWPDTLHGGIATTVIQDALDTHLKNFPGYLPIRDRETVMNYRLPLHPGVIYSVLVRTDKVEPPGATLNSTTNQSIGVGVEVLVNEMTQAPHYVDAQSDRLFKVYDAQKGVGAYVQGVSTLFLAAEKGSSWFSGSLQVDASVHEKLDDWKKTYRFVKAGAPK